MPAAKLPLDLTTVQLMLVNWVAKGHGEEQRELSPELSRDLELVKYHWAFLETAAAAQWRKLEQLSLGTTEGPEFGEKTTQDLLAAAAVATFTTSTPQYSKRRRQEEEEEDDDDVQHRRKRVRTLHEDENDPCSETKPARELPAREAEGALRLLESNTISLLHEQPRTVVEERMHVEGLVAVIRLWGLSQDGLEERSQQ